MAQKILLVEDDPCFGSVLKSYLELSDYEVTLCVNGNDGLEAFRKDKFDICLLDVMMPEMDGFTLGKKIREIDGNVPFVYITAKSMKEDMKQGYEIGADDYIVKPYNPTILLLRIHAIFRRLKGATGQLNCGGMEIMPQKGVIKYHNGEKEMLLTKNEMTIFAYLLSRRETIVSRDELMTELWNNEEYINDNALTVNISRLRGKLKEMGCDGMIETRKGQGYILREGDKE